MIQRQTILILGAGASAPFGFPTGYQLLQQVIEKTTPHDLVPNYAVLDHGNFLNQLGHDAPYIRKFRDALLKSGKTSVDAFLEHRSEFIPIGKAVMAIALIQYEDEQHLFKRDGGSWYEYLFNQLNARFEEFNQNQLSILTFNYDRSLEHFLFTALQNATGKSEEECAEQLKSIPIIHLHGDLGALPQIGKGLERPYNTNITLETLNVAIKRIKIIHEGVANEPQFEQARHILSASEVICFLGFGYHPVNVERLGIRNRILNSRGKEIMGTSLGLTSMEAHQVSERCGFDLRSGTHPYGALDVLEFLRETGALHSN